MKHAEVQAAGVKRDTVYVCLKAFCLNSLGKRMK